MSEYQNIVMKAAKVAEMNNNWREAAIEWRKIGRMEDAEVCNFIADCNDKGDYYRQRVLDKAGPEPNLSESPHAWVKWYKIMTEVYNEVYNPPTK